MSVGAAIPAGHSPCEHPQAGDVPTWVQPTDFTAEYVTQTDSLIYPGCVFNI